MKIHTALLAALFVMLHSTFVLAQGSLTPPGAPAPTMKKLDEVEARTNLQGVPAPAGVDTTNVNYHFIINQPGSYYLSANVGITKTNGIQINAEGVTLELNGFQISRSSGSGGNGIEIPATSHRANIRNGSIKGFAYGVRSLFSAPGLARGCGFRDLAVSNCTSTGILAGPGAILEACRVHDSSGDSGLQTFEGATLTNCTVTNSSVSRGISTAGSAVINCTVSKSSVQYGIFAGIGASLTNCSATGNNDFSGGFASYGIFAFDGSSLINCSAAANTSALTQSGGIKAENGCTLTNCTARGNVSTAAILTGSTGAGFTLSAGCTIQNSTASANSGDGIAAFSRCVVRRNHCDQNSNGAGVHVEGSDSEIENNNVIGNDSGIRVGVGGGNLITRNSASGNGTNYLITQDNRYGIIVDDTATGTPAVSGNSAAATTSTTSAVGNFSY